jgi:hypothetical protein
MVGRLADLRSIAEPVVFPAIDDVAASVLVAINDMTLSGVTRRADAGMSAMQAAESLSIEPFERSRWRLRRTRSISMGVESYRGRCGRADVLRFPVPGCCWRVSSCQAGQREAR